MRQGPAEPRGTNGLNRVLSQFDWRTASIALVVFFMVGNALSLVLADRIQSQAIESVESGVMDGLIPRLQGRLTVSDFEEKPAGERAAELEEFFFDSLLSSNALGVRVWSRDSELLVESMAPSLEREGGITGNLLAAALSGKMSSGIRQAGESSAQIDLIEVYLPIRFDPEGEVVGSFQVYEDYSLVGKQVAEMQRLTVWGVLGTLSMAYLLLMWFTQRRHSLILRQHRALEVQRDDLRRANRAIRASEERFRSLVLNVTDVVLVIDRLANIIYVSPSVESAWHREPESLKATCLFDLMDPEEESAVNKSLDRIRFAPRAHTKLSFSLDKGTDWEKAIEATATNLLEQPSVGGIVLSCRDVTERRSYEQKLTAFAFHDALTGLPNRRRFMADLAEAAKAANEPGLLVFLLVDVDRLKTVNDSLGHPAGDALIEEVARRLTEGVPTSEVGRLGGDEFAMMKRVSDGAEAVALARQILAQFGRPFRYGGNSIPLSVSVGMVMAQDNTSADTLVLSADIAMYRAKASGGGTFVIADSEMEREWMQKQELERDLREVTHRDELRLYYQPVIDLATGAMVGMESLVRWTHPDRGLVHPSEFIRAAESTGQIFEIGRWTREAAFEQAREWLRRHPSLEGFRLRINLSAVELQQNDFVWSVASSLREAELDPTAVEIEVTESAFMRDPDIMSERLHELRSLGVTIAIDDFGTGYSALNYLRVLPVETLKVGRSFVADLENDPVAQTLVETMVMLGHSLGFDVVAEGIENEEQRTVLLRLGCTLGQGSLFAEPLDADEAGAVLEAYASDPPRHWRAGA